MNPAVVLDAAAFDVLDSRAGAPLRGLLREAATSGSPVCCAAVTLAELCRGVARTRRVEAALAREYGGRRVVAEPTDVPLAKLVGSVLYHAGADSSMIADAHVVAVAASVADAAIVVTGDPSDIRRLADALPGARILVRSPLLT